MTEIFETWWSMCDTLVLLVGSNGLLALSIHLALACGLLSMANAVFMGIGAYVAAQCTLRLDWSFGRALAAGALAPALLALLVGGPTLRLAGVYRVTVCQDVWLRPAGRV